MSAAWEVLLVWWLAESWQLGPWPQGKVWRKESRR
jgi:hypothetical protein